MTKETLPIGSKLYTYQEITHFSLEHLMDNQLDKIGEPIITPLVRKFRKDLTELRFSNYNNNKTLSNCSSIKEAIFQQRFHSTTGIAYITCEAEWNMKNEDCYFYFHKDSDIVQPEIEELVRDNLESKIKLEQEKHDAKKQMLSKKFLIDAKYLDKPIYEISDYAYKLFNTKQTIFQFLNDYELTTTTIDFIILYTQILHKYGIK